MRIIILLTFAVLSLSCRQPGTAEDTLRLKHKLEGTWEAMAFSGKLHETWELNADGWMQQQGYYLEEQDTAYSAKTKIEKVGDDLILFSVIKNANPRIFKAVSITGDSIVFENNDYKNPFRVTYAFLGKDRYKRTITGYEKDSLVVYEFDFKKRID
ncbi:MAG: hypothetical protein KDD04_04235 [Sinomicrobium sp.]|nr:hypothetical protein [Sinomicrobium sp.]